MTDDEALRRADANYFLGMSRCAANAPGGEVREHDGVLMAYTNTPFGAFNIAFVTRPLNEPVPALRRAIEFFDQFGQTYVIRIREGVDAASERAAESLGFPYSDTIPGMILSPANLGDHGVAGLEIRTIDDATTLDHHRAVVSAAFEMSIEMAERIVTRGFYSAPDVEGYVGYIDGQPIATSALVLSRRTAGVYDVATLASHRGRGIGEAMTAHAVRRGIEAGALMASLQASEMGQPIYARMGFRNIGPYRTFVRPVGAAV